MENPFSVTNYADQADLELVRASLQGNRQALEMLILRHQPFLYNVALKMTMSPQDAEDVVQEVLLKAITSLSQFQGKSAFRTWLYRIAFNHILNMGKRSREQTFSSFEGYGQFLDAVPNTELTQDEAVVLKETVEEVKLSCMSGMLLCLDREQRLVYILGEVFGIDHRLASEFLEISPDNFRQKLARARRDLYNFMNNKCGLVNKDNPCRCAKKTKGLVQMGIVDPERLQFNAHYVKRIHELIPERAAKMLSTYEEHYQRLFGEHPFQQSARSARIVDEILNNKTIREIFELH
ncbi:MAG TPA: RNA polymerase sigma factor [Anaerolineales bacterium]|nr:RNA polymerase sigma factor [Anaerolineales bacterium]